MKAILKEDLIISLSLTEGIEIGNIPNGVSLERLRWDGEKIVDLSGLSAMWVRLVGDNYFELHAIQVPMSEQVALKYNQRRDLRFNNTFGFHLVGDIVKADEVRSELLEQINFRLKQRLGDAHKQLINLMAFNAALIVYASEQPAALKSFFDDIAPHIKDAFPFGRYEAILKKSAVEMKQYFTEYHNAIDEAEGDET